MKTPSLEKLADNLLVLAEWMRENFEETEVLDVRTAEPGINIRLQVTRDGWQTFHEEESDADEEDGLWASAWLPYDSEEDSCEEIAEQLIDEITEELELGYQEEDEEGEEDEEDEDY